MKLEKLGMPTGNGFPFLTFEERLSFIKKAKFDSLILWWGDDENIDRKERVILAEKYALEIEHAHGSTDALNALWLSGNAGDDTVQRLKNEIFDCSTYGIDTLVLHLTNGSNPPAVTEIGMKRILELVKCAEKNKVNLAFENIRLQQHLDAVLNAFSGSERVGLCYDAGHKNFWTPENDWLEEYKERVFAIHLHDNFGDRDAHLPPLEGNIDWPDLLYKIQKSSYKGSITLEAEIPSSTLKAENVTEKVTNFLNRVQISGEKLRRILQDK